jgi:D-alanine transaminase
VAGACPVAWLDGGYLPLAEARVPVLDRGFLFADAVYEAMPVYDGRVYRLGPHLDRLERSLGEIRMGEVLPRERWRSVFGGLIARNGGGDLLIYLQVTRGVEPERSHVPAAGLRPTLFAMASRLPALPADPALRGVEAVTAEDIRWGRCDIKSTALLANVLLKWSAQDAGATEAVLLRDGALTEGAASSVHVVRDGRIVSPPLTARVLPGTTRDALQEIAPRCGVEALVDDVGEYELRRAPEIILASAGGGVRAVTRLDGRPVGAGRPGPVFSRLYETWFATRAELSVECTE